MVILEIPSNRYKIRVKTDNSATIFDLVPLSFILLKEQSAEIIRNFTCDLFVWYIWPRTGLALLAIDTKVEKF